jgi:hypothetical protein
LRPLSAWLVQSSIIFCAFFNTETFKILPKSWPVPRICPPYTVPQTRSRHNSSSAIKLKVSLIFLLNYTNWIRHCQIAAAMMAAFSSTSKKPRYILYKSSTETRLKTRTDYFANATNKVQTPSLVIALRADHTHYYQTCHFALSIKNIMDFKDDISLQAVKTIRHLGLGFGHIASSTLSVMNVLVS